MAKILYLGTSGSDDPTRAGFPSSGRSGPATPATTPRSFWPAKPPTS
jgi:hypothetical protein